jgi:uncharacterized phage infection (PIP) family protein YhgE
MSDITVVNDDGVKRVSASLKTTHDNFNSAYETLKNALAQYDGAWGNDSMGQNFANGYKPSAQKAEDNSKTILGNIGTLADDMIAVIKQFHSTDNENANNTNRAGNSQQSTSHQTYTPGSVTGPGPARP